MFATKNKSLLAMVEYSGGVVYHKFVTGKPGKTLDKQAEDYCSEILRAHGARGCRVTISEVIYCIDG
jgi:hypothetical protein